MKLLKNGILYDSSKGADLILKAESATGTRTLLVGRNSGRFFELFGEGALPDKIIPMGAPEAFDFCEIYKEQFASGAHRQAMLKYFPSFLPKQNKTVIPDGCVEVAGFGYEKLWHHTRGHLFYLETMNDVEQVTEHAALEFIEANQDMLKPERLKTILKTLFPTIKRA